MATKKTKASAYLIVDDSTEPKLALKPGMRFEVHATTVVTSQLQVSKKVAARLCGGTSTCLALIDLDASQKEKVNPQRR